MHVLFVGRSIYHFTYYESVLAALLTQGHKVSIRFDEAWSKGQSDVAVKAFLESHPQVTVQWSQVRVGRTRRPIFAMRELRSYSSYLQRPDQSDFYRQRWRRYLEPTLRNIDSTVGGRWLLKRKTVPQLLRLLENKVPAAKTVIADLRQEAPDVLVASPANMRFAEETEYLKAAKQLRIPTAVLVLSWDNLSTKGLLHTYPNLLLAWNHAHASEATRYHGILQECVLVTGAPFFDKWFEGRIVATDRGNFCRNVGLEENRPFVLYLGSSANIARDETWLVSDLVEALDNSNRLRGANILARPHPANARPFARLAESSSPRIVVWPQNGQLPENNAMKASFYDSVRHAAAIVGLNTSAMIDILSLDQPCVAMIIDRYQDTQLRAQHFQHLLQAGVFHIARNTEECACQLEAIATGSDAHTEQRREFLAEFVRPHGLNVSAGELAAAAIVELGRGTPAASIAAAPPQELLRI